LESATCTEARHPYPRNPLPQDRVPARCTALSPPESWSTERRHRDTIPPGHHRRLVLLRSLYHLEPRLGFSQRPQREPALRHRTWPDSSLTLPSIERLSCHYRDWRVAPLKRLMRRKLFDRGVPAPVCRKSERKASVESMRQVSSVGASPPLTYCRTLRILSTRFAVRRALL